VSGDLQPTAPRSVRVRKRDQQIRRFVRHLRTIAPHVDRSELVPLLRSYAMITLTLERSYAALKERSLISTKTDELRSSIDVVGRLVGQQAKLAEKLGLTPAVAGKLRKEKTLDLAGAIADAEMVEDGGPTE